MSEAARKRPTYADIEALPPHLRGEILAGELVVSPRPAPPHARAASALGGVLYPFDRDGGDGPGGWWIDDEPELHLDVDPDFPVVVPDLAGWGTERLPTLPETAAYTVRPDWIVHTGTANGGLDWYLASICDLLDHGRILSIDHKLADDLPQHPRITYLEAEAHLNRTRDEIFAITGQFPVKIHSTTVVDRYIHSLFRREQPIYKPLRPKYVTAHNTISLDGNCLLVIATLRYARQTESNSLVRSSISCFFDAIFLAVSIIDSFERFFIK